MLHLLPKSTDALEFTVCGRETVLVRGHGVRRGYNLFLYRLQKYLNRLLLAVGVQGWGALLDLFLRLRRDRQQDQKADSRNVSGLHGSMVRVQADFKASAFCRLFSLPASAAPCN